MNRIDATLAAILIELMDLRSRRGMAEKAARLEALGYSRDEAAVILGTTAGALTVAVARADRSSAAVPSSGGQL